jgi:membrane-associated phospholipid phosphatase
VRSLDRHLYLDTNSLSRHTHWAHGFMAAYALWAGLTVLALLVVGAWLWARQRGALEGVVAAVLAGVSGVVALGVNHFVSSAVARVRPCHALRGTHHLVVILGCAHDYSFPSDHAIIAGALATGLVFFNRSLGLAAWVLALFLGFARVYAGVHYPGDVVAGLLAGGAIAIVIWFALRAFVMAAAVKLSQTPLRPLVAAGSTIRT